MPIDQVFAGGKAIWELLGGLIAGYERERERLLVRHVEPLHVRMLEVHRDYVVGFEEIRSLSLRAGTHTTDIVEFVKQRRRAFEVERDLALHLARAMRDAERRIVRTAAWDAVLAYCRAIDGYLSRPFGISGLSSYSTLLAIAEWQLANERVLDIGPQIFGREEFYSGGPVPALVDLMLNSILPAEISKVNAAYADLRIKLQ